MCTEHPPCPGILRPLQGPGFPVPNMRPLRPSEVRGRPLLPPSLSLRPPGWGGQGSHQEPGVLLQGPRGSLLDSSPRGRPALPGRDTGCADVLRPSPSAKAAHQGSAAPSGRGQPPRSPLSPARPTARLPPARAPWGAPLGVYFLYSAGRPSAVSPAWPCAAPSACLPPSGDLRSRVPALRGGGCPSARTGG